MNMPIMPTDMMLRTDIGRRSNDRIVVRRAHVGRIVRVVDVVVRVLGEHLNVRFLRVVEVGEYPCAGPRGAVHAAQHSDRRMADVEFFECDFAGFLGLVVEAGGGQLEVGAVEI